MDGSVSERKRRVTVLIPTYRGEWKPSGTSREWTLVAIEG